MAELFCSHRAGQCGGACRSFARDDTYRNCVRTLRRPLGACVSRWSAPHTFALLPQQRIARFCRRLGARLAGRSPGGISSAVGAKRFPPGLDSRCRFQSQKLSTRLFSTERKLRCQNLMNQALRPRAQPSKRSSQEAVSGAPRWRLNNSPG